MNGITLNEISLYFTYNLINMEFNSIKKCKQSVVSMVISTMTTVYTKTKTINQQLLNAIICLECRR